MAYNEAIFEELHRQIDSIPTKEEAEKFIEEQLQPIEDMAKDMVAKVNPTIEEKLAKIKPYVDAVQDIIKAISEFSVSLNPASIIALVTTAIAQPLKQYHLKIQELMLDLKPPLKMYNETITSVTQLADNISELQKHLKKKIEEGKWDIQTPEINIPSVPSVPLLDSLPSALSTADSSLATITGLPTIPLSSDDSE